jgi:hypothetical protein
MRFRHTKEGYMRHRHIILAGLVGIIAGTAAMFVGTVLATSCVNFGNGSQLCVLGSATLDPFRLRQPGFAIRSKDTTDVVIGELTIEVGGDTGWHTHPGPTFVTVAQGSVEVTILTENGCTKGVFGPEEDETGFVEAGNEVHIARNVGDKPVVAYVTFLAVPVPDGQILDLAEDPECS